MEGNEYRVLVTEDVRRGGEDARHSLAGQELREATEREAQYAMRRLGFLPDGRLGETQH